MRGLTVFENLGHPLDQYSENYENSMFIRDFNMSESGKS